MPTGRAGRPGIPACRAERIITHSAPESNPVSRRAGAPARRGPEAVRDGDSLDWKDLSAGEITKRVLDKVSPGSIVLFHNAALHTPEALPGIIEALLREGYTFAPISQLILPGTYNTDYTIDHTGRQCPV